MEHENKCHVDDDGQIIDGTNIWTSTEIESIILLEVSEENHKDAKDLSDAIAPSNILKNNNEIKHLKDLKKKMLIGIAINQYQQ